MAIQQITNKRIIKYDTTNPNFVEKPKPKVEVSGNVSDDEDVYGERKHTYTPEPSQTGVKAIEVDIKKEIAIGKVDMSAIKSEEVKGKVNNKLNKLKALRKRNGSK